MISKAARAMAKKRAVKIGADRCSEIARKASMARWYEECYDCNGVGAQAIGRTENMACPACEGNRAGAEANMKPDNIWFVNRGKVESRPVVGETSRSWVIAWWPQSSYAIDTCPWAFSPVPKSGGKFIFRGSGRNYEITFTGYIDEDGAKRELAEQQRKHVEEMWIFHNRSVIAHGISRCCDVETLLKIADLLGVVLPEVGVKP